MGTCHGEDAPSPPVPAQQSHAGTCALARDQSVPPRIPWGWGRGRDRSCGSQHRLCSPRSPSPCPGHTQRAGEATEPTPLPHPGWAAQAGGCHRGSGNRSERGSWADGRGRGPEPCPTEGRSRRAPLGKEGICATEPQTQKGGGKKNPARLNFVPFNTRVITTSGNLPPTQLCARINWKSIITITNNSLLAFIASKAWRNSHRRFPHRHLPSDVGSHRVSPCHEGQRREERGP